VRKYAVKERKLTTTAGLWPAYGSQLDCVKRR